jgi:aminoglycoside 6'-N-acetyltransferase
VGRERQVHSQQIELKRLLDRLTLQFSPGQAGFTREGVLRSAQWRGGAWHDLVIFSKLRGE